MSNFTQPRRLSEKDMAQLYMQTEAALRLDALLQGQEKGDAPQIAVHDSIGGQTPDLALISLSLCALVIARDFPVDDTGMGPVLRELSVCAEDNLVTVGRLWLDTSCHGIEPEKEHAREVIISIPDRLRILTSIFMELRDALDTNHAALLRALKTMYYQAESHADLADKFIEPLTRSPKKAATKTEEKAPKRKVPDQVPLPFELTRPKAGADVVTFSLFRERSKAH